MKGRDHKFRHRDKSVKKKIWCSEQNTGEDVNFKNCFAAATYEAWTVFIERQFGVVSLRGFPEPRRKNTSKESPCTCFLWNPDSKQKINLPDLTDLLDGRYFKCILTAPPTSPQCLVIFLEEFLPIVLFCRLGSKKWISWRYDHNEVEEIALSDAITCNGKLFTYNKTGQLREFVIGSHQLHVRCYKATVPKRCPFTTEQLVECCGELFIVTRKSVFDVDVFKFDIDQDKWIGVSNLGNRSFILMGNYSLSVSADELGMRSDNMIYFTENDDDESLYAFKLDSKSLSVFRNHPNSGTSFWICHNEMRPKVRFSNRGDEQILSKSEEIDQLEEARDDEDLSESIWYELGEDMQKLIFQRLPTVLDYINCRAVCKNWRSLLPPLKWKLNHNDIPFKYPWLMFGKMGNFILHDPVCNLRHRIKIPELIGCDIWFSKQGWLLATKPPESIFFFEPFTRRKVQLPNISIFRQNYWFDGVCFSDPPTASDWKIFAIRHASVSSFHVFYLMSNSEQWTHDIIYLNDHHIFPAYANLVFDGERFCCLAKNGNLIFFKITESGYSYYIESSSVSRYLSTSCRGFLVCHENEVISVFLGQMGRSIHVFKLDRKQHKCVEIKSLEKRMLYLSHTTCLGVEASEHEMLRNTIQFSMVNKGHTISYSLKNQKYQTNNSFQPHSSLTDLYDSCELMRGIWIQPLLMPDITFV